MAQRKAWKDLSPFQRISILIGISVQISLLASALVDIWRRPSAQIRGPKPLWVMASFINFVGPIGYFTFGRKPRPITEITCDGSEACNLYRPQRAVAV